MSLEFFNFNLLLRQGISYVVFLKNLDILSCLNHNFLKLLKILLNLLYLKNKRIYLRVLLSGKLKAFRGNFDLKIFNLVFIGTHFCLKNCKHIFVFEGMNSHIDGLKILFGLYLINFLKNELNLGGF